MCAMFGLRCFDDIISDDSNYKKCPKKCLTECKTVSLSYFAAENHLDTDVACNDEMKKYLQSFQKQYEKFEVYDYLTSE